MHAAPSVNRAAGSGQFTSPTADLEEAVVDHQAELDEIAIGRYREAQAVVREIAIDEVDDLERFRRYQAVERTIRVAGATVVLQAFHELVAHVEADERREDRRRRNRIPALRALVTKVIRLRRTFRDAFVPLIRRGGAQ